MLTPIQVFRKATQDAIDLISALLEYTPTKRLSAIDAMVHPFFDELRQPDCRFPDSRHAQGATKELPKLFDFSRHGRHYTLSQKGCLWSLLTCLQSFLFPLSKMHVLCLRMREKSFCRVASILTTSSPCRKRR